MPAGATALARWLAGGSDRAERARVTGAPTSLPTPSHPRRLAPRHARPRRHVRPRRRAGRGRGARRLGRLAPRGGRRTRPRRSSGSSARRTSSAAAARATPPPASGAPAAPRPVRGSLRGRERLRRRPRLGRGPDAHGARPARGRGGPGARRVRSRRAGGAARRARRLHGLPSSGCRRRWTRPRMPGYIGTNAMDAGFDLVIEVRPLRGAAIIGEETALLRALEGKRAMPDQRPPHPEVRGLFGKPTVVHSVETLAARALDRAARPGGVRLHRSATAAPERRSCRCPAPCGGRGSRRSRSARRSGRSSSWWPAAWPRAAP